MSEDGNRTATILMALGTEPLSAVTVMLTSTRGALSFSPSSLEFDYLNYSANVSVVVGAMDDKADQGDAHIDQMIITVSTEDSLFDCLEADRPHCGLAAKYANLTVPYRNVTVLDDDEGGVAVSASSLSATYNNFGDALSRAAYNVSVQTEPLADVVVSVHGLGNFSTVTPNRFTITAATWRQPVTVQVAARAPVARRPVCRSGNRFCDDLGSRSETVTHVIVSDDPLYDGAASTMVHVDVDVEYDLSDPPKVLSGQMTNLLNALVVTFDQDTDRAGVSGSFPCTALLDVTPTEATALLGAGSYCSFLSASSLKVTFGSWPAVTPGSEFSLQDLVLQAADASASLFTTNQTFRMSEPDTPTVPVARLKLSSASVGVCDGLVLDASSSSGSGGRSLRYNFTVHSENGGDVRNVSAALNIANRGNDGMGTHRIVLASATMPRNLQFAVAVTVTNFLGFSDTATVAAAKLNQPVPSVSIQGDNPRSATHSESLTLKVNAAVPSVDCIDGTSSNSKLGFTWVEDSGKFTGPLSGTSKNPRALVIQAGALEPLETYTFRAIAFRADDPSRNNSAAVSVVVAQQGIVARIEGGSVRQVGVEQSFTLDGRGSSDPDNASVPFAYTWSCAQASTNASCPGLNLTASGGASSILTVAAGGLSVGSYELSLFVQKGSIDGKARNDTASTVVIVIAGAPPIISLGALTSLKYNTDDVYLSLSASVASTLPYTGAWTIDDSDVDLPFIFKGVERSTVQNKLSAVLFLSALTVSNTYTVRFAATDSSGASSYSTVSLTMNEAPSSGSLDVFPATGFTLETEFTFTALNWVDDDLPLSYIFGLASVDANGSTSMEFPSPFGSARSDAAYDGVTLPQGDLSLNFSVHAFLSHV